MSSFANICLSVRLTSPLAARARFYCKPCLWSGHSSRPRSLCSASARPRLHYRLRYPCTSTSLTSQTYRSLSIGLGRKHHRRHGPPTRDAPRALCRCTGRRGKWFRRRDGRGHGCRGAAPPWLAKARRARRLAAFAHRRVYELLMSTSSTIAIETR